MIEPGMIPQYTGDFGELEKAASSLRTRAGGIRSGGGDVHSRFQGIAAHYKAPEAHQLLGTTGPVKATADDFADNVEALAGALETFVKDAKPYADRLKQLRADAFTFVESVAGDDDWTDDEAKSDKHQALMDDVAAARAGFEAAERAAANKINAISPAMCRPEWKVDDGTHKPGMYGYTADMIKQAKELPWGTPEQRTYETWSLDWWGHGAKSVVWDGIIKDNVWGGIRGGATLFGWDGSDAAGDAWGSLKDAVTGIGLYTATPYDWVMDHTIGPDEESADEKRAKQAAKDFFKGTVAWDTWGENPARASGTVIVTVGTFGLGGLAGSGLRGSATAAKAARVLEFLDPVGAGLKAGQAVTSLPKMSEIIAKAGARLDGIPGPNNPHTVWELDNGYAVHVEDGKFTILDSDNNPITAKPKTEPAGTDLTGNAPSHDRELATVGGRSPEGGAHVSERSTGPEASSGGEAPPVHGETGHAAGGADGGGAGGDGIPHHPAGDGGSGSGGAGGDSPGLGGDAPDPADGPKQELTAEEKTAVDQRLADLEDQYRSDFDVLKHDPDHEGKVEPSEMDEARVGIDLREQGKLPADIQRPLKANQGDYYSPSTGQYYDLKGVHSDWPPLNTQRDKSMPFRGAYDPQNNGSWEKKMTKQIEKLDRTVIIDTRNANQAAIDDIKAMVERRGWGNSVIWYP
ncbi:hypothetical protein [Streptomyces sp. MMG1533]|uniref:hypothetical protein n=1 Tax=Streptomyces sp. MMG1533 TaxID=1415546 RepID=UPI0006AE4B2E|nr:hypothetical protein [Streptomyces sp. MMG1533]